MNRVTQAQETFGTLIRSEFARIERMKADRGVKDFSKLNKIVIGILPGDGIGCILRPSAAAIPF